MIYLDNAATTFPKSENVYVAMDKANRELAFNAGRGSYHAAQKAADIIAETRDKLAELFSAKGYADVVFTPSITHALNQVINGLTLEADATIYISAYEHNAVARTLFALQERTTVQVEILPMLNDGEIDLDKTEYLFSIKKPSVIILNALSNVTGYVLPTKEVFELAKGYGAITVLDAAQAAGLIPLDMQNMKTDILCFASHKTLYGPFGVGGFLLKRGVPLRKALAGGTGSNSLNLSMPEGVPFAYEAASMNVVSVYGLLASLREMNVEEHYKGILELTDYLLTRLEEIDRVRVLGAYNAGKTLGIVSFIVEGYSSNEVGEILNDEFDIAVRTGYHCAPYIHEFLGDIDYNGTVRIGLGKFNGKEDIDALIEALESL